MSHEIGNSDQDSADETDPSRISPTMINHYYTFFKVDKQILLLRASKSRHHNTSAVQSPSPPVSHFTIVLCLSTCEIWSIVNKKDYLEDSWKIEGRVDAGQNSGHGTLQLRHEGQHSKLQTN